MKVLTLVPIFTFNNNQNYTIYATLHFTLFILFLLKIGCHATLKLTSLLLSLAALLFFLFTNLHSAATIFLLYWVPTFYYIYLTMIIESYSKIDDNLYLSNYKTAANKDLLKKLNVSCVVECFLGKRVNPNLEGIEYLKFEFDDRNFVDITKIINETNKFIDEKKKENKGNLKK
jgi:hypothetical protein